MPVVMSIMAIIMTVGFASFRTARLKARDATRKSDLAQIRVALEIYYSDYGQYPESHPGQNTIRGGGVDCETAYLAWGADWSCGPVGSEVTYMSPLPDDPMEAQDYRYERPNQDEYYLETCLELANDLQGVGVASSEAGFTGLICDSEVIIQTNNP